MNEAQEKREVLKMRIEIAMVILTIIGIALTVYQLRKRA